MSLRGGSAAKQATDVAIPLKSGNPYCIYIVTNKWDNVLYAGVTNNLIRRISEHQNGFKEGFTKRYRLSKLVYYEVADTPYQAITREKQIKSWSRKKKIDLIQTMNPQWKDVRENLF